MMSFVCFGEVLIDVFPSESKIGGAPLNVASRLASFGNKVNIISAIGNDAYGKKILDYCSNKNIDTKYIQISSNFKTGEVIVTLNEKGNASYEIIHPKAWDKITSTNLQIEVVKESQVFVFGSLITRDPVSKSTLIKLLSFANYKVFDVNLRPPFYSIDLLVELMNKADFIKFNDEELYEISEQIGSPFKNIEQNIKYISKLTNTNTICVTKGEHGAVLFKNNTLYYNSGYKIKVVDTVGSGDSFLATLIHYLQNFDESQKALDMACAMGALVASRNGATPIITEKELNDFMCY